MIALITGATSGLGKILCRILAAKNYSLLITGRNTESLKSDLPQIIGALPLDLAQDRTPLIEWIQEYTPDLVINNAGYTFYGPALRYSTEEEMDILEVNANAAIELTLEAARALSLKKKNGVILNVSSVAGEYSIPSMALYAAAKKCLTSFSLAFDAEMKPHGIRILTALPGPFQTPFAFRASQGKYHPSHSMSAEVVAQAIWKQIEKKKNFQIIGWQNQLSYYLSRFIPRPILNKLFLRSLEGRYQ